jgi:CHAT domain-containing protein/Tfp pilus assembly protein PilF
MSPTTRSRWFVAVLSSLALSWAAVPDTAADPPQALRLTAEEQRQLNERARSLEQFAQMHEEQEDFPAARKAREEVLAIQKQLHGDRHWQTTDARLALKRLDRLAAAHKDQRQALRETDGLLKEISKTELKFNAQQVREFRPRVERALELTRRLFGQDDPKCGEWITILAYMEEDKARTESLLKEALQVKKKTLGEEHPEYADILFLLGNLYQIQADYARAEPVRRKCAEITKNAVGENDPQYAVALNNLAVTCMDMGDLVQAGHLFSKAKSIFERAGQTESDNHVATVANLAEIYTHSGQYEQAEKLYLQCLNFWKKKGEVSRAYATLLNNLAILYSNWGKYTEAEALYSQTREIEKKLRGGRESPNVLHNLGTVNLSLGNYARAEDFLQQSLKLGGGNYPVPGTGLLNLACLYYVQRDFTRAKAQLLQALERLDGHVERTFAVQSESQQLALANARRSFLDFYLSLAPRVDRDGDAVYQEVLAWKGAVFARQLWVRQARNRLRGDPEAARIFGQLQERTRQVAGRALTVPAPGQEKAWQAEVQQLTRQKERLEKDLAERFPEYRRQQEAGAQTSDAVKAVLPEGTVLIDLLEYTHTDPPPTGEKTVQRSRHVAAFVVRRNQVVRLIDLGPVQPITAALQQWRKALENPNASPGKEDHAAELRRQVWQRLEPYVHDARVVLVSPDGALTRLPWGALPGRKAGTYLIEDVALSVVPVPQLLPALLADKTGDRKPVAASLLLVGDVAYDAQGASPAPARLEGATPGKAAPGGGRLHFDALFGAVGEVRAIRALFEKAQRGGKVESLSGAGASEAGFRWAAPGKRYLHLATHGFFAPPELRSALGPAAEPDRVTGLNGFDPGLLSGLALAGANRVPDPAAQPDPADDGILTALEVSQVDLRAAELVVLSACQTGLGSEAGGEGLLGLQRAFQVSGARTVLASLWKVDDEATRELMLEFYRNLWENKLGKLEALCLAQREMIRGYNPREHTVRLRTPGKVIRLDPKKFKKPAQADAKPGEPLPPFFWAAFVLSGDWR